MKLLDLINHLKEVFEKDGNLEVLVYRNTDESSDYPAILNQEDIHPDPARNEILLC